MNFEPQKFFVGIIEFFAILLPGALLTFFLWQRISKHIVGAEVTNGSGTRIAVFFFCSYVLGHFVFLIGALILDKWIYDPLHDAAWCRYRKKHPSADTDKKPVNGCEWLAGQFFSDRYQEAMRCAELIKKHDLDPLAANPSTNIFQWCKARLTFDSDAAIAAVQRFEADSKFFRSFVVVLTLLLIAPPQYLAGADIATPLLSLFEDPANTTYVIVLCLLILLALWRYFDQRTKATSYAVLCIITAESRREDGYRDRPKPPSHAGGVVRRGRHFSREFLLVAATAKPNEWVLPKGHIESGESSETAATREVYEETGVWTRIEKPLERIEFTDEKNRPVSVQFYLMEALDDEDEPAELRRHQWLLLPDAIRKATHPETKRLLASQFQPS